MLEEARRIDMSTPGRRRALKALSGRRRANRNRIAGGQKPIIKGKQVSLSTFNKKTGAHMTKKKAQELKRKA
jgi:hypothetical protein